MSWLLKLNRLSSRSWVQRMSRAELGHTNCNFLPVRRSLILLCLLKHVALARQVVHVNELVGSKCMPGGGFKLCEWTAGFSPSFVEAFVFVSSPLYWPEMLCGNVQRCAYEPSGYSRTCTQSTKPLGTSEIELGWCSYVRYRSEGWKKFESCPREWHVSHFPWTLLQLANNLNCLTWVGVQRHLIWTDINRTWYRQSRSILSTWFSWLIWFWMVCSCDCLILDHYELRRILFVNNQLLTFIISEKTPTNVGI